jgi:hypothetical protein
VNNPSDESLWCVSRQTEWSRPQTAGRTQIFMAVARAGLKADSCHHGDDHTLWQFTKSKYEYTSKISAV